MIIPTPHYTFSKVNSVISVPVHADSGPMMLLPLWPLQGQSRAVNGDRLVFVKSVDFPGTHRDRIRDFLIF